MTESIYSRQLLTQILDLQGGSWQEDVTRGNKSCWCQGGKDLQEVANTATESNLDHDWVFPWFIVTPGLRASCLTSWAEPDVAPSASLAFNGKATSSQHELIAALSACRSEGDKGKHGSIWAFDVIIRNFKASVSQRGTIPLPCSGWLESNFRDLCQDHMEHGFNRHMVKMFRCKLMDTQN